MAVVYKQFYVDVDNYNENDIKKLIQAGVTKRGDKLYFKPGIKGTTYAIGGAEGIKINGVEVDVYNLRSYVKDSRYTTNDATVKKAFYYDKEDLDGYSDKEIKKLVQAGAKWRGNKLWFSKGMQGQSYKSGPQRGIKINGVEVDLFDYDEYVKDSRTVSDSKKQKVIDALEGRRRK